jgi:hypothetical protein
MQVGHWLCQPGTPSCSPSLTQLAHPQLSPTNPLPNQALCPAPYPTRTRAATSNDISNLRYSKTKVYLQVPVTLSLNTRTSCTLQHAAGCMRLPSLALNNISGCSVQQCDCTRCPRPGPLSMLHAANTTKLIKAHATCYKHSRGVGESPTTTKSRYRLRGIHCQTGRSKTVHRAWPKDCCQAACLARETRVSSKVVRHTGCW